MKNSTKAAAVSKPHATTPPQHTVTQSVPTVAPAMTPATATPTVTTATFEMLRCPESFGTISFGPLAVRNLPPSLIETYSPTTKRSSAK